MFKDWLAGKGALKDWLRLRVRCMSRKVGWITLEETCSTVNDLECWNTFDKSFRQWIYDAFPEAWRNTDRFWVHLCREWNDMFEYTRASAKPTLVHVEPLPVPGMPLNDSLALALILAELEAGDGNGCV